MLSSVVPEQGEYIRGHAGRLSSWNGFRSTREFLAFLKRDTRGGGKALAPDNVYRLMAVLSGLDTAAYLKTHSLLPFCRIGAQQDEAAFDYEGPASSMQKAAWLQPRKSAYFCRKCAAVDEQTLGFSYWRAFHQLPGIDVCPTHGTALAVVGAAEAFDRPPGSWTTVAQLVEDRLASLSGASAVVRYTEIAQAFMANGRRVSRVAAARCIKAKLLERSLPTDAQGRQFTLAHCIRVAFPADWLAAHYPRLRGERDCVTAHAVNGLCDGFIASGMTYAMALSATFSASQDALRDFYTTPGRRLSTARAPMLDPLTAPERCERLLPYYVAAEGVATGVAGMLGITKSAAITLLRSAGLRILGGFNKPDRERVVAFLSRASKDEIECWIAAGSNVHAILSGEVPGRCVM